MSVFIIAEAGVNHNGSIDIAKKLIDVASDAGADAVKFQTFKAKDLVSKIAQKAEYQKKTTDKTESQFDMIKKLELNAKTHEDLISYCKSKHIIFLSSPFDIDSINFLNDLGLEVFKIPSGEITNLPYLREIGKLNKKVILSTGMANIDEIQDALDVLRSEGTKKENITVLHANTMYPTPMKDVNLKAMITIGNKFDIAFGYSDHTLGIEVDIAAVAIGAQCREKHFTLDNNAKGPDHSSSLNYIDFSLFVKKIRETELMLGSFLKKINSKEQQNAKIVKKSIYTKTNINIGEVFSLKNLSVKRPKKGKNPSFLWNLIGKKSKKKYKSNQLV